MQTGTYRDTFTPLAGKSPREIEAIFYGGSEAEAMTLADQFPLDLSISSRLTGDGEEAVFSSLGEIYGETHRAITAPAYLVVSLYDGVRRVATNIDRGSFEARYLPVAA